MTFPSMVNTAGKIFLSTIAVGLAVFFGYILFLLVFAAECSGWAFLALDALLLLVTISLPILTVWIWTEGKKQRA